MSRSSQQLPGGASGLGVLSFVKHHGLGNDFVLIDARALDVAALTAAAPALCDRHRGVGADGLLLLLPGALPRMRVVNADGSVPEMCGNGLRCFVQWLDDQGLWRPLPPSGAGADGAFGPDSRAQGDGGDLGDAGEVGEVETDAGRLRCGVFRGADGRIDEVEVAMGVGAYEPAAVPVLADAPLIDALVEVDGVALRLTALSIGNPHAVTFDALDLADRLRLGPALERHLRFPARVNAEFCTLLEPDADGTPRLQIDVYERGCGWTQACGTGATAAVIAGVRTGRLPASRPVRARLPGGWLTLTADADGRGTMRGPTRRVYAGSVDVGVVVVAAG